MTAGRKILVTGALPYANGDIHIGHLVEYIQADIWVRFQKLRGHECLYFCADDTHGTPIMIEARKKDISPEKLIEDCHRRHEKDFLDFEIEFDYFGSTNDPENKVMAEEVFSAMVSNDHLDHRAVKQAYCDHDKMFLPDRFVRGECPKCGAKDQYGDSCDVCCSTYSPTDLVNPACSVCGNVPSEKESQHIFFQLSHFQDFLKEWVPNHTQKEMANKLKEWFDTELRDWDISRDEPYFGFEIPGHPKKYFYVWVDAPVGYISASKIWCDKNNRDYKDFWISDEAELYHFIGKDIVYFHALFWPAMLKNAGYRTPSQIFVHGMLSVNGEKMSKSKGTFINARTYLNHLDPMYLRYYYASKLTSSVDDFDLSFDDFKNRVNSELVGKITNLGSRGAQMLNKKIDGKMGTLSQEGRGRVEMAQSKQETIAHHFENREYSKAIIEIREIADEANRYFDEKEPWKLIKVDVEATREVLTVTLNIFRMMSIYLKPILPSYAKNVEDLFKEPPFTWESLNLIVENHEIGEYKHLAKRVESKQMEAIVGEELSAQRVK